MTLSLSQTPFGRHEAANRAMRCPMAEILKLICELGDDLDALAGKNIEGVELDAAAMACRDLDRRCGATT